MATTQELNIRQWLLDDGTTFRVFGHPAGFGAPLLIENQQTGETWFVNGGRRASTIRQALGIRMTDDVCEEYVRTTMA